LVPFHHKENEKENEKKKEKKEKRNEGTKSNTQLKGIEKSMSSPFQEFGILILLRPS